MLEKEMSKEVDIPVFLISNNNESQAPSKINKRYI